MPVFPSFRKVLKFELLPCTLSICILSDVLFHPSTPHLNSKSHFKLPLTSQWKIHATAVSLLESVCCKARPQLKTCWQFTEGEDSMWAARHMNYGPSWNNNGAKFLLGVWLTDQRASLFLLNETSAIMWNEGEFCTYFPQVLLFNWICNRIHNNLNMTRFLSLLVPVLLYNSRCQ